MCLLLYDDDIFLECMIYDLEAASTIDYLTYHQHIINNPTLDASFKVFDTSNPFDPIKLRGTIPDPKE